MDQNTAQQLQEELDKRFLEMSAKYRDAAAQAQPHSVERDVMNAMKLAFNHLRKVYGKYRTLLYLIDSIRTTDEEGVCGINMATDISSALGMDSQLRLLLMIDGSEEEGLEPHPEMRKFDLDDVFLNALESVTTSFHDDVLIATNFLAGLGKVGYLPHHAEIRTNEKDEKIIRMTLVRKKRVVRLYFNTATPAQDKQTNMDFVYRVGGGDL